MFRGSGISKERKQRDQLENCMKQEKLIRKKGLSTAERNKNSSRKKRQNWQKREGVIKKKPQRSSNFTYRLTPVRVDRHWIK